MICYLDMTFCPYWEKCTKAQNCARALTQDVIEQAKMLGLPICRFSARPGCFREDDLVECPHCGSFLDDGECPNDRP